eukprot:CAMPEP_0204556904 /NCGR_PEP_ID=MMETSP0661-20131031/29946_1 /ASSEMBLY_ACC=CAM_ASM_000606 /TAXON_ID=109239 /ORGANISM="Alexandrium margalefi, Strain AMGDE01CS-322" /LENGTH=213 /DNA_ID=CAMNT_0051564017 /DNA_START=26 /DNA_END=663 /DNA_ORIENTATION=-
MKGPAVMKSAAEKWKAMALETKRPWEDAYKKEQAEYQVRYKDYVDSGKKDAWDKPPGKPKKPLTAFFQYAVDYRQQNPYMKSTQQSATAAALWKDMTAEQKKPYEQKYAKAKEQYALDLKAYDASGQEALWKEKVGIAAKERDAAKKKEAAAAKKTAAAEKKKAAAEKKKAAAEKKKQAAAAKKKAVAEKTAAAKKAKAADGKKKAAGATKKA